MGFDMALFGRTKQQALAAIKRTKDREGRKRVGGGSGSGSSNPNATIPTTPNAPFLTALQNAISVSYAVPPDGGSPILEAQFTDSNGVSTTLTTNPQTITKAAGAAITGAVRFRNALGWSDYSLQSNSVTPTAAGDNSAMAVGSSALDAFAV